MYSVTRRAARSKAHRRIASISRCRRTFALQNQLGCNCAEVFNIFNHTNFRAFSSLNNSTGGANFGRIGTVRDPRTMQFGAVTF